MGALSGALMAVAVWLRARKKEAREEEDASGPTVGDWQKEKGSGRWLGRWICIQWPRVRAGGIGSGRAKVGRGAGCERKRRWAERGFGPKAKEGFKLVLRF